MKVGYLIKLCNGHECQALRGIILKVFTDPLDEYDDLKAEVFWTDGDLTEEWCIDLEVICK